MPISEKCSMKVDPLLDLLLKGNDVIMARRPEDSASLMRDFERNLSWVVNQGALSPVEAFDMRQTLLDVLKVSERPVSEWPPTPFAPFYIKASEALYDAIVKCECEKR